MSGAPEGGAPPLPSEVARAAAALAAARAEPRWLARRRLAAARAYARAAAGPLEEQGWLGALARLGLGWVAEASWTGDAARAARAAALARLAAAGAFAAPLDEVARADPERLRRRLGRAPRAPRTRLGWLLEALWTGGLYIEVPAEVEATAATAATAANAATAATVANAAAAAAVGSDSDAAATARRAPRDDARDPPPLALSALGHEGPFERTVLVLGRGARLGLLRGCARPRLAPDPLRADQVEAFVGEDAALDLASLDHIERRAASALHLAATAAPRAWLSWSAAPLAAEGAGARVEVRLAEGARARLALAGVARGERRLALEARVDARGAGARAEVRLGALVADGGHAALRSALAAAGGAAARRKIDAALLGPSARVEVDRLGAPARAGARPLASGVRERAEAPGAIDEPPPRLATVRALAAGRGGASAEEALAAARRLLGPYLAALPSPLDGEVLAAAIGLAVPVA